MNKTIIAAVLALGVLLALPAGALARDRDHDRMGDRWERHHHLRVGVKDARRDPDRDGLMNLGEFRSATDPHDGDTDDDCLNDAAEDRDHDGVDNQDEMEDHTNPADVDTDNDDVDDGDEDADHDGVSNAQEDEAEDTPADCDDDADELGEGDRSEHEHGDD